MSATAGPHVDEDPRNPHDLAVDIQTDLQKLATIIAHAGASPQAVQELTRMAQVMSQVVKVLGGAGPQPPAGGPPQGQPAPAGPPPGPPAPQGPPPAAGPPQGAPPAKPPPLHQALHHATKALHSMTQSAAAQQQQ